MRTETRGDTLFITGITNLGATNAPLFKELAHACLEDKHRHVEADFGPVRFVDSVGLGALLSVHKKLCERQSRLRLINPSDSVEQFLRLLHLDQVFEIVRR
jgi:anti-sigma B factor antagonist